MRTRKQRAWFALWSAVPLVVTLALTGCGGPGDGDTAVEEAAASRNAEDEKAVKYAECLREHGLDVEDPGEGGGVRITGRVKKDVMDKAMEACRDLNPMEGNETANAEAEERMREQAACMRKNGVEDFPDPDPGKGLRINKEVLDDPDFEKAEGACEEYTPDAPRGGGDE
ncbi:hypothetical protein AB0G32_27745 [Streptomyces sp. NPDC023723]|uniref:hypothetical protein n=1 Tax=Streptomyces sp. NPDC023723 TaxID=3154323 RepID=UPI00340B9527